MRTGVREKAAERSTREQVRERTQRTATCVPRDGQLDRGGVPHRRGSHPHRGNNGLPGSERTVVLRHIQHKQRDVVLRSDAKK